MIRSTYLSVATMVIRATTIVARFGLAIYMAKYLSLEAVGRFGLLSGAVSMAPAVLGWGINYFAYRDLVDKALDVAGRMMRDRLIITLASVSVGGAIAFVVLLSRHLMPFGWLVEMILIVVLESISIDLYSGLVSMRLAHLANGLLFIRSASWVGPVVACGIFIPRLRTLEVVLLMWLAGLVLNFMVLCVLISRYSSLRRLAIVPVDWAWIRSRFQRGGLIYVNDIGMMCISFADRYIVDHFLGLAAAGVFTFYWSVANAVHMLVTTGIIQPSYPRLVSAYTNASAVASSTLRGTIRQVGGVGCLLGIAVAFVFPSVLRFVGKTELKTYQAVLWLMLGAAVVRLVSDTLSMALGSRRMDRAYAHVNLLGIGVTILFSAVGVSLGGLKGACWGAILTQMILGSIRWSLLRVETDKPPR